MRSDAVAYDGSRELLQIGTIAPAERPEALAEPVHAGLRFGIGFAVFDEDADQFNAIGSLRAAGVGLTNALPSAAMNARRLIRSPRQQVRTGYLQSGKTQKQKRPKALEPTSARAGG
jgi:hypothetical protein